MELHIQSEFDCVYSINGEFYERADSLTMSEYDVVYVTVFPLKHTLLRSEEHTSELQSQR